MTVRVIVVTLACCCSDYFAGFAEGSCQNTDEEPFPDQDILWKDKTVWYSHDKDLATHKLRYIRAGMDDIESKTCVRFKRNDDNASPDFVKIEANLVDQCSAAARGNKGGEHKIDIGGDRCEFRARILHILMHVLGFGHIHQRPDRDYQIYVNESNIIDDKKNCFEISTGPFENYDGHRYDFQSVLHYGPYEWAKDKKYPTLTSLDCRFRILGGDPNRGLSPGDVLLIDDYYCHQVKRRFLKAFVECETSFATAVMLLHYSRFWFRLMKKWDRSAVTFIILALVVLWLGLAANSVATEIFVDCFVIRCWS